MYIDRIESNLKSPDGEPWTTRLARLTYVYGTNRQNKSAVPEALSLAITGGVDLPRRPGCADKTRLISLAPAPKAGSKNRHLFAKAYMNDELIAEYHLHQTGKGTVTDPEHTIHRPDIIDSEWVMPLRQAKAIVDGGAALARRATLALADRITVDDDDEAEKDDDKPKKSAVVLARLLIARGYRDLFDEVVVDVATDKMTVGEILSEVEATAASIGRAIKLTDVDADIARRTAKVSAAADMLGKHTKAAAAVKEIDEQIDNIQTDLDAEIANASRSAMRADYDDVKQKANDAKQEAEEAKQRLAEIEAEAEAARQRAEEEAITADHVRREQRDAAEDDLRLAENAKQQALDGIRAWTEERERRLSAVGGLPVEVIEAHLLVVDIGLGKHEHADAVLTALKVEPGTCTACGMADSADDLRAIKDYYEGKLRGLGGIREADENIADFKLDLADAEKALAVAVTKIETLGG